MELTPEATPQQTALDANDGLEKSDNAISIASTKLVDGDASAAVAGSGADRV